MAYTSEFDEFYMENDVDVLVSQGGSPNQQSTNAGAANERFDNAVEKAEKVIGFLGKLLPMFKKNNPVSTSQGADGRKPEKEPGKGGFAVKPWHILAVLGGLLVIFGIFKLAKK